MGDVVSTPPVTAMSTKMEEFVVADINEGPVTVPTTRRMMQERAHRRLAGLPEEEEAPIHEPLWKSSYSFLNPRRLFSSFDSPHPDAEHGLEATRRLHALGFNPAARKLVVPPVAATTAPVYDPYNLYTAAATAPDPALTAALKSTKDANVPASIATFKSSAPAAPPVAMAPLVLPATFAVAAMTGRRLQLANSLVTSATQTYEGQQALKKYITRAKLFAVTNPGTSPMYMPKSFANFPSPPPSPPVYFAGSGPLPTPSPPTSAYVPPTAPMVFAVPPSPPPPPPTKTLIVKRIPAPSGPPVAPTTAPVEASVMVDVKPGKPFNIFDMYMAPPGPAPVISGGTAPATGRRLAAEAASDRAEAFRRRLVDREAAAHGDPLHPDDVLYHVPTELSLSSSHDYRRRHLEAIGKEAHHDSSEVDFHDCLVFHCFRGDDDCEEPSPPEACLRWAEDGSCPDPLCRYQLDEVTVGQLTVDAIDKHAATLSDEAKEQLAATLRTLTSKIEEDEQEMKKKKAEAPEPKKAKDEV
jgi:hypothetical protein